MRVPSASVSLRSAVVAARIAAVSFRVCMLASVRSSESAALNKYACYKPRARPVSPARSHGRNSRGGRCSTHALEILRRQRVALDAAYSVNEQRAGRAHEIARDERRKRALEHAEESVRVERRVQVFGRVRRLVQEGQVCAWLE